jgi:hypothetical protein
LELWGFDGCSQVNKDDELLSRLRSERRGPDAAFMLSHGGVDSLWVHIHDNAAFLCYLPDRDGKHAGFVPDRMWDGERRAVQFLQTTEGDTIEVEWYQLVPVEAAYRAAVEYLHMEAPPPSVSWFEL